MSLEEAPTLVHDTPLLPKSVKVRSTCNACQQAKIRCSHEKPSCRRCQKQKMECIYSMSRRLGRPSKKRPASPLGSTEGVDENHQAQKRRRVRKRKSPATKPAEATGNTGESLQSDDNLDISSIEESSLMTPTLSDPTMANRTVSVDDCLDFAPDSWLHLADYAQEMELFDGLHADTKSESAFRTGSGDFAGYTALSAVPAIFADSLDPAVSFFGMANFVHEPNKTDTCGMHTVAETPASRGHHHEHAALTKDILASSRGSPDQNLDFVTGCAFDTFDFGDLDFDLRPSDVDMDVTGAALDFVKIEGKQEPGTMRSSHACDCYKSTAHEILELSTCTGVRTQTSTIENQLKCQKSLNQLARQLLECTVCPRRTQIYLLVITLLGIDELLTSFEEFAFSDRSLFEQWPSSTDGDIGWTFGGHIQTCPVSIGEFQVSFEEKTSFIKQALYSRIAALWATVRQVRLHAEQECSSPRSRGKLIMTREVDRRLDLLMRRIKLVRS